MNSQEIESRLRTIRSRIRSAQIRRALWVIATVALGGLILIMAADYFFAPLPQAARWILSGAWLAGLLFAVKTTIAPLLRKITLIRIARWLEARHPEMDERLSTVLELSGNGSGVSPELLHALASAADQDIRKVDPRTEVKSAQTSRRWGRPAAALTVLLLITLVVWPREISRLMVRAVAPFSDRGNAGATRFTIKPGDIEITEGDPIRIEIGYDGKENSIDLLLDIAGRKTFSQPLARDGEVFTYTLDPARESFTYRAQSGRARSDAFTAKVHPLPRISEPKLTLAYPAYTNLPETTVSASGGVEAVEGTRATLTGTLNTVVSRTSFEIDGKPVEGVETKLPAQIPGPITFTWTLTPSMSGEAVVRLTNPLGRETEALRFPVESLADLPPQVAIVLPTKKEIRVRPDEILEIQYEVTEDFALARTLIEAEGGKNRNTTLDLTLPFAVPGTRPPLHTGTASVSVGLLSQQLVGANEIRIRVRADDARPSDLGGPGIGRSEWLTLRIDRNAESLARQTLRAEHDEARETLQNAINETRQAKDQLDSLRDEIKKDQMPEHALKRLEQATEKLAAAEQKAEQIAEQMENSVHAAKAEQTEKAAENIEQSREALENAPLQDTPEKREQQLAEAKQNAEQAIKQLEEVRERMDRDREKVQDLARLQELAQQQRELARQAQENVSNPPESPQAAQEWQNQQRQVAEQIKQQLREQPQARAEALKQQAENAKALAEEARQIAETQKQLQQQAAQTAKPEQAAELKEQLENAISEQQAALAQEAKEKLAEAQERRTPSADQLPEATAAAEKALEELKQDNPQAAANAAKEAAEALKKAADPTQPSSDALSNLAERQEQLSGAMEAVAEGKLDEALKALQEAQAETAENLAESIAETPLVDQTGNTNQATDNARQGSRQAQEAAKQSGQPQSPREHEQAAANFEKSAEALDRAAQEFARQAEEAAGQQANPNKAPVPAAELAEAFGESMQAATTEGSEAAQSSEAAADALEQAASQARSEMQGQPSAPKPGSGEMPGSEGLPGQMPPDQDGLQKKSGDPGVPPELAKLGISAADWEKIRATLSSDVGARGADAIPEEYRGLVKGYFESMTRKKD